MAEYTAIAAQVVAENQNILFTETVICGGACITRRRDSGLVTVKGASRQCRAMYRVLFNANIAVPETGTVAPIALAIAVDGEALGASSMIYTPAAVGEFGNVSATVIVEVPCTCCETLSIRNISTQAVTVQNANIIIERIA